MGHLVCIRELVSEHIGRASVQRVHYDEKASGVTGLHFVQGTRNRDEIMQQRPDEDSSDDTDPEIYTGDQHGY